jgi:hypothetical protein
MDAEDEGFNNYGTEGSQFQSAKPVCSAKFKIK